MARSYGTGDRVRVRTITSEMEAVVINAQVEDHWSGPHQQCKPDTEYVDMPVRAYRILGPVVQCIGDGSKDAGCGSVEGQSGDTCSVCGGMMLGWRALREADRLQRRMDAGQQ